MEQRIDQVIEQQRSATKLSGATSSTALCKPSTEALRLLETYNPSLQDMCVENPMRCVTGRAPTLFDVRREYGRDVAIKWLTVELNDFNNYVGVKEAGKQTLQQQQATARSIIANFGWLKLSEVLLFFGRLKGGMYTEMFGVVDPQRITKGLRMFLAERAALLDRHEREKAVRQYDEWAKNAITHEEYLKREADRTQKD